MKERKPMTAVTDRVEYDSALLERLPRWVDPAGDSAALAEQFLALLDRATKAEAEVERLLERAVKVQKVLEDYETAPCLSKLLGEVSPCSCVCCGTKIALRLLRGEE